MAEWSWVPGSDFQAYAMSPGVTDSNLQPSVYHAKNRSIISLGMALLDFFCKKSFGRSQSWALFHETSSEFVLIERLQGAEASAVSSSGVILAQPGLKRLLKCGIRSRWRMWAVWMDSGPLVKVATQSSSVCCQTAEDSVCKPLTQCSASRSNLAMSRQGDLMTTNSVNSLT